MAWASQWPPSGRPVAAQWPPQWPPSGRPQIMEFLIKYALKKEKARVLCILFLKSKYSENHIICGRPLGGHWGGHWAATGRPLRGHCEVATYAIGIPKEYQWKHTITVGRGQLSECAGACREAPVLGSCTRQFTNSLLPHAKRDFLFFCTLYKAI